MRKIEVPYIDYEYVGRKLCDLRQSNSNLLKYVCYSLNEERLANVDKWDASSAVCTRDMKCDDCHRPVEREVSQGELARVLGVSERKLYRLWAAVKNSDKKEDGFFAAVANEIDTRK